VGHLFSKRWERKEKEGGVLDPLTFFGGRGGERRMRERGGMSGNESLYSSVGAE